MHNNVDYKISTVENRKFVLAEDFDCYRQLKILFQNIIFACLSISLSPFIHNCRSAYTEGIIWILRPIFKFYLRRWTLVAWNWWHAWLLLP